MIQIINCDNVSPAVGICKHILWQFKRIFRKNRYLTISNSIVECDYDSGVCALINSMNIYDYNNMSFIKQLLSSEKVFIDVGANIGAYTLLASEISGVQVISIEPHPTTFKSLQKNILLNNCKNINCLNFAVSNLNGKLNFSNEKESSIRHVLTDSDNSGIIVECRTLDSICDEFNIIPFIVKIDVEGHEENVLTGFKKYIEFAKIILIERGDRASIMEILRSTGFVGPLYIHYKNKIISHEPQKRAEDPVFIRNTYLQELKKLDIGLIN
jgi:FkbM family methyltransferase